MSSRVADFFFFFAKVYLDSPGLEYTKTGKKLAIDP